MRCGGVFVAQSREEGRVSQVEGGGEVELGGDQHLDAASDRAETFTSLHFVSNLADSNQFDSSKGLSTERKADYPHTYVLRSFSEIISLIPLI